MTYLQRIERRHNKLAADQRSHFQRDRDRILYSSAFHRLAGITQVISPSENRICHSRLTHSLKVAQVALRLSEYLLDKFPKQVGNLHGIDSNVVESASLAHDIGHPPFGHAAEMELQECISSLDPDNESYEGNAQSFRVVTRLAVRSLDFFGLDLTRATLNAILKYPFKWDKKKHNKKWGVYYEDLVDFDWARRPLPGNEKEYRTVEAEVMDTADDIAYAVHDLEDFYKAGLIPIDRLVSIKGTPDLTDEGDFFIKDVFTRNVGKLPGSERDLTTRFLKLLTVSSIQSPYQGLRGQKALLRNFTSSLINQYITTVVLKDTNPPESRLVLQSDFAMEIFMLQQLTWYYVILNPALSTQQFGQRSLIRELFKFFFDASLNGNDTLLPTKGREMMNDMPSRTKQKKKFCARIAADIVSNMTEHEAKTFAHRILGISTGSVFDHIL